MLALTGCKFSSPVIGDAQQDAEMGSEKPIDQLPQGRITDKLVSVWKFDESTGTTVGDSGSAQPVNLTVSGTSAVTWVAGGLRLDQRSQVQSGPAHFNTDCRLADGATFEAWVTPADNTQGGANYAAIGSVSVNPFTRNLTLAQVADKWSGSVRTTTSTNGDPPIESDPDTVRVEVTHLVLVADSAQRVLYVNGRPYLSIPTGAGDLTAWDNAYPLIVGDENNGYDRHWLGTVWFMAVYKKALSRLEVMANYAAGYDCSDC